MNSNERVSSSINHKEPDRIPLDGWFTNAVLNNLKNYLNVDKDEDVLQRLGIDFKPVVMEPAEDFRKNSQWLDFVVNKNSFSVPDYIAKAIGNNVYEDEWGVRLKLNEDAINWGYIYHPLEDLSFKKLMIPDLSSPGRMDVAKEIINKFKDKFIYTGVSTCFRRAWLLIGFSRFLETLLLNRNFIEKLLDYIVEYEIEEVRMHVEAGVNMIELLGDLGSEESLFISPDLWREIFKPRMKSVIDSVKEKNIYFFLHTDGNIEKIIPDLIEIGINVLNPIQPECIDPVKIKKTYGDKITMHGSMSLQRTLSFGSPEDVIKEADDRIKNCGNNGGLILAPSNVLTHDVPVKNIVTFYDYVQKYKL